MTAPTTRAEDRLRDYLGPNVVPTLAELVDDALAEARAEGAAAERARIAAMLEQAGAEPGLVAAVRHVTAIHSVTAEADPCVVCGGQPAANMPGRHADYRQDGHTYQAAEANPGPEMGRSEGNAGGDITANGPRATSAAADPPDADFLNWCADRFVYQTGESENVDFVQRLRRMARLAGADATPEATE